MEAFRQAVHAFLDVLDVLLQSLPFVLELFMKQVVRFLRTRPVTTAAPAGPRQRRHFRDRLFIECPGNIVDTHFHVFDVVRKGDIV